MSWDDIDLDIIKEGMITRASHPGDEESEQASFSEILNQFSQAANERLNMMMIEPEDLEIEFFKGEIRNTDFWVKYRELIVSYQRIMGGFSGGSGSGRFYREGVMTDPINHEDYVYTADDFRLAIGADIYDIIILGGSSLSYTISQIFLADLIQGFYTIYTMTGIFASGNGVQQGTVSINNLTATDGDYLTSPFVDETKEAGSYAAAKGFLNWEDAIDPFPLTYATFHQNTYKNLHEVDIWEISGRQSTSLILTPLISKNNQKFIYKAEDLGGTVLEMEFTGFGNMSNNFTTGDDYPGNTAFDSNYPFNSSGTSSVEVEWGILSESQEANGTVIVLGIKGGQSPIPETLVEEPMSGGFDQKDGIIQSIDSHVFVRINNEALDFHIP